MTRKILELNLYDEPIYIDLNLVCAIGQIERYVPDYMYRETHYGFVIKFNIAAPFSTNNEYKVYFTFGGEHTNIRCFPHTYKENSPRVSKLYDKVVEIRNQIVDIWSGKTPGDNFVIQLSEKDLTQ